MNQNQFSQPHVQAKLRRSGAVETWQKTKKRTVAAAVVERGLVEKLSQTTQIMTANVRQCVLDESVHCVSFHLHFLLENLPTRHPEMAKVRTIATDVNKILKQGMGIVEDASTKLPYVDGIRFKTRGKANLILAHLPV